MMAPPVAYLESLQARLPANQQLTPLQILSDIVGVTITRQRTIMLRYLELAKNSPLGPDEAYLPDPEVISLRQLHARATQATLLVQRWTWVGSLLVDGPPSNPCLVAPHHVERWVQFYAMRLDILHEAELFYGPQYQEYDPDYRPFVWTATPNPASPST